MIKGMENFPKGEHGFYLPSIKTLNNVWELIASSIDPQIQLAGAIDDLFLDSDKDCGDCGTELIRVALDVIAGRSVSGMGPYFMGGLVLCRDYANHPGKKAWVEVWPNANAHYTEQEFLTLSLEERIAGNYRLSDSRIRQCYRSNQMLTEKPLFVHPSE